MLKTKKMQGCIITQHTMEANIHLSINMFINNKYNCRDKMVKNTHRVRTHPTTSYVAAMFHPTIGQRAHQSLNNTTTPELGMIP